MEIEVKQVPQERLDATIDEMNELHDEINELCRGHSIGVVCAVLARLLGMAVGKAPDDAEREKLMNIMTKAMNRGADSVAQRSDAKN